MLTQSSVPNGGYVASVILSTMRSHTNGPLSHLEQPDTMSMQLQYLRRTSAGPGIVTIRDVKLGRSISVLHVTLSQNAIDEVEGYLTQTNFAKQQGVSLPTTFASSGLYPPPPSANLAAIERCGEDDNWFLDTAFALNSFRKAMKHIAVCRPKHRPDPSLVEQWVRFQPGGPGHDFAPFTNDALGFVVDAFPMFVDQYPATSELKRQTRWYPTVALNVDIKKRLPVDGLDWLYVRVRSSGVRDGRMDLQIVVLDHGGDVIALSSHVTLMLSEERNKAKRRQGESRSDSVDNLGKL